MPYTRFEPSGPHPVGFRDLGLVEAEDCDWQGNLDADPQFIIARFWYPSTQPTGWSTAWLTHWNTAYGYASSLSTLVPGWKGQALRIAAQVAAYAIGSTTRLAATADAPLLPADATNLLPVAVFSHGDAILLRHVFLALPQGYLVVSLEHADGTAAALHVPEHLTKSSGGVWRYYTRTTGAEMSQKRLQYRCNELLRTRKLLEQLNKGEQVPGLHVSGDATFSLAGRLDLSRVIMMGHSFGGTAVGMLGAQYPEAAAVTVAVDPWWGPGILPPQFCALNGRWNSTAPLLIVGSYAWNTPAKDGVYYCGKEELDAVLNAARAGPGAVLLVPAGSEHDSFNDIALFSASASYLVNSVSLRPVDKSWTRIAPRRAIEITALSALHFAQTHLVGPPGEATQVPVSASHKAAYETLFGSELAILTVTPGAAEAEAVDA